MGEPHQTQELFLELREVAEELAVELEGVLAEEPTS